MNTKLYPWYGQFDASGIWIYAKNSEESIARLKVCLDLSGILSESVYSLSWDSSRNRGTVYYDL